MLPGAQNITVPDLRLANLLGVSLIITLILYAIINFLIVRLSGLALRLAVRTRTHLGQELLIALRGSARYISIWASAYAAIKVSAPDMLIAGHSADDTFSILAVFLVAHLLNGILMSMVRFRSKREGPLTKSSIGEEVIPILSKIVLIVVYAVALLLVLNMLKIDVAPLLAGLGIAGLAVALALQDSLTNFFAGVYVVADRPIRVGDFIELQSGKQGYVEEMGWRSVRIRTYDNNTLIIPNAVLSQSMIVNYNMPSSRVAVSLLVQVEYSADPEFTEKVLFATAKNVVGRVEGAAKDFSPIVRVSNLAESGVDFEVFYRVEKYTDKFRVASEMRKEVLKQFKKHDIPISFPTRTIHIERGDGARGVKL